MKKIIVFLLTAMVLFTSVLPAFADYTGIADGEISKYVEEKRSGYSTLKSDKIYMLSLDDGETVMYEKNADTKADPASLVKLVVGILALRECGDVKQKVTVQDGSLDHIRGTGWGTLGVYDGEEISVEALLYATLMANANDTCFVLADTILGGIESCVEKMNRYAQTLGCENTQFTNVNGTPDAMQYTTARDMVTIYRDCLNDNTFREIMSTAAYEVEQTNMVTRTRYASTTCLSLTYSGYSNEYVSGGRYAGTEKDRCNTICTSSYGGYNYICCVLDAPIEYRDNTTYKCAFTDSNTLFNFVHRNIKLKTIATTDTYCGEARVKYSTKYDYVSLSPELDVIALVPANTDSSSFVYEIIPDSMPEALTKSVKKGDYICDANVKYAGTVIARVRLVAGFDVTKNPLKVITATIGSFAGSRFFTASVIGFIVLLFAAVVFVAFHLRKKNRDEFMRARSGRNGEDNNQ